MHGNSPPGWRVSVERCGEHWYVLLHGPKHGRVLRITSRLDEAIHTCQSIRMLSTEDFTTRYLPA